MRIFIKKILVFLIPVAIYVLLIVIIDPFAYFNIVPLIDDKVKIQSFFHSPKTSMLGNMLWKLNDFNHHPKQNLIIGDSRAFQIKPEQIKALTGEEFYNLAVPGSDCKTVIDLFWYAVDRVDVTKVYIALGFHNYSKNTYRESHFIVAQQKIRQVWPFFTETSMIKQVWYVARLQFKEWMKNKEIPPSKNKLGNKTKVSIKAKARKQKKWDKSIAFLNRRFKYYTFPEDNIIELQKIANYCNENNIQLKFIIFPNNKDVHQLISKHQKTMEFERFKADICSVGDVIDFDYDNDFTQNYDNYDDPGHISHLMYQTTINAEIFVDTIKRKVSIFYHHKNIEEGR